MSSMHYIKNKFLIGTGNECLNLDWNLELVTIDVNIIKAEQNQFGCHTFSVENNC